MFDLDHEIAGWRREMSAAGLAPEALDELESHLRDDIARRTGEGASAADAFLAARRQVGAPQALRDEFARARPQGFAATLRSHRWKIRLCTLAGLVLALVLNFLRQVPQQAEAMLIIRHDGVPPAMLDAELALPMALLRSFDLARGVARNVGPDVILKQAGGGADLLNAASVVARGLTVDVPPGGSVVRLRFRHPDATVVRPVLDQVGHQYLQAQASLQRRFAGQTDVSGARLRIVSLSPASAPATDLEVASRAALTLTLIVAGLLTGLGWVLLCRLGEVYGGSTWETLCLHRWKLLLCTSGGLVAGVASYVLWPQLYQSEAKLIVRYVDAISRTPRPNASDEVRAPPSPARGAIMKQAIAPLRSTELLREVVASVGPQAILQRAGGGEDFDRAVAVVRQGLDISVPPGSAVIRLRFMHPDAAVVRPVLQELTQRFVARQQSEYRSQELKLGQPTTIAALQFPPPPYVDRSQAKRLMVWLMLGGVALGFAWMVAARLARPRVMLAN